MRRTFFEWLWFYKKGDETMYPSFLAKYDTKTHHLHLKYIGK